MTRITLSAGPVTRAFARIAFGCAAILAAAACSDGTGAEERTPLGSWVRESHVGQPYADSLHIEQAGPGQLRGRFHPRLSPRLKTIVPGTYDDPRVEFRFPQGGADWVWEGTLSPDGKVLEFTAQGTVGPFRYRRASGRPTPITGSSYEYTVTLPNGSRHEYRGVPALSYSYVMGPTDQDYATSVAVADSLELFFDHPGRPLPPTGNLGAAYPPLHYALVLHQGLGDANLDRAASSFVVESSTEQALRVRFRFVLTRFAAGVAPVPAGTVEGTFTALRLPFP